MKQTNTRRISILGIVSMLSVILLFQSCREDLEGTYPVIKQELIGNYLENHPQYYSEFTQMLNTCGVMGLLKAYGEYTVFAPTNEAMERYYRFLSKEKGVAITSLEQLSMTERREICYNHIIRKKGVRTKDFHAGILDVRSMSDRFYSVTFTDTAILINDYSPILARDIVLHNGIVHALGEAITPAAGAIAEVFEKDSMRFSIYVKALKVTGVYRFMNMAKHKDEGYSKDLGFQPNPTDRFVSTWVFESKPESRKLGFTILAVSDADLANCVDVAAGLPDGIHSLADLEKLARYHYGIAFDHDADTVTQKTNPIHYLNRFISYHCFNRTLYSSRFVKDYFNMYHYPEYPMPEYIETMMENTIVEVLLDKQGKVIGPALAANPKSQLGVFNYDDPAQGALLTEVMDMPHGGAKNGYYHGINKPIMYTKSLSGALSSKRLRMDIASFFPELATNNIRNGVYADTIIGSMAHTKGWVIDDVYLDDYEGYGNTRFTYEGRYNSEFMQYQCDECIITGMYNYTFKTCPIPAGTYEVRLSLAGSRAGTAQLFLDSIPCGIPMNLDITNASKAANYVEPGTDMQDPYGFENDKMMRNYGYMKAPCCYFGRVRKNGISVLISARQNNLYLRKIIGTFTFEKAAKHSLTAIMLGDLFHASNNDAMFVDYIEFCPVSYLDKEGID